MWIQKIWKMTIMIKTFKEFEKKWSEMPIRNNGFLSLELDHPLRFQIGYSNKGYKSLAVMDTKTVSNIPSSNAIEAENRLLRSGKRLLLFQLLNTKYEEEFLHLCWDMIESTSDSNSPEKDLIARYSSWQKLLKNAAQDTFGFKQQKGLIGELLYLSELLKAIPAHDAVNAWKGPEGCHQDFEFESSWAEIKTTALSAETVRISSLQQLDHNGRGILVIYTLEKSAEGTERISLPSVVNKLRNELGQDPMILDRFEMKLFKYGYRSEDEEKYRETWFRFVEKREYLIEDGFPRLYRNNVPIEITSCDYELSIPAIEKFRRK